ncbi:AbrB/MazE/SpoVT family DNA-binding domain-containing protein [Halogeometricum sp. S1BR25-6]|uniref:AbrB/MazE/SpoVT family DNA-binding domain-containing protein n=1 Tax=Halogeometricum salsisoli TaxID=2950536 RepID=A0ABU2GHB4_9EURY|nr:AbrB/MazE/SpoVT family DNA-binding domain-containing protein [Halogeometricum sp. S1BR25-6]MDS0300213.1 AbrB/MazE/SpoVT family DNA-binding domain-containing protein [Halogeometricum sp. S1BR25-6]
MVTIPAAIRRRLAVEPGDTVRWEVAEDGALSVNVVVQSVVPVLTLIERTLIISCCMESDSVPRDETRYKCLLQNSSWRRYESI